MSNKQQNLFTPFRALGHVTNDIPFSIQARGQDYFLTTGVGNSFHVYDVAKLGLLFVGPRTETQKAALASSGDLTFVATGKIIICCRRTKEVNHPPGHKKRKHSPPRN